LRRWRGLRFISDWLRRRRKLSAPAGGRIAGSSEHTAILLFQDALHAFNRITLAVKKALYQPQDLALGWLAMD
jgi:hypothetical protein